jgi:hypothetical protein
MASVIRVGNDHLSSCRASYITWHPSWVDAEEMLGVTGYLKEGISQRIEHLYQTIG